MHHELPSKDTHHGDAVEEKVALVEKRGAHQALRSEEGGGIFGGPQVDGAALGEEDEVVQ